MKILGLDSSGLVAGVAVAEDGELVAEYTINYKKTHSQTLLPMLDALRNMIELDMHTVDAIAVASRLTCDFRVWTYVYHYGKRLGTGAG